MSFLRERALFTALVNIEKSPVFFQNVIITAAEKLSKDVVSYWITYCDCSTKQLFVFAWLCIVLRCWLLLSLLFSWPITEPLPAATGRPKIFMLHPLKRHGREVGVAS